MAAAAGLRGLLRRLGWARLGIAALIFVGGAGLRQAGAFPDPFGRFALAVAGLAATALVPLLAPRSRLAASRLAWLQVSLDVVLVTGIVATSGGPRSLFSFVYVLVVMEACLLLSRTGGLVAAAAGSLLYAGVVLERTLIPLIALGQATETTALEVLTVFVNAGVLVVSAVTAGYLAERYRGARRDLEVQRRHLSDVQAFRDLIFESVGTGLVAIGPDHRISAFNRAAETISGVPAGEALGRPWQSLFGAEIDLARVREGILADDFSQRHEFSLQRRDGRRIPVGISFWLLRTGQGDTAGLIGVCQDLSSIKQMEERMRQADRLAAVGRLAANIAHEIRNPLASVSGAIEALAADLPPETRHSRLVEIVLQESSRLNALVAQFLDYARPAPLEPVEVDTARVLDEVLVLLEHRPLPDGLKVVREFGEPLLARADPQQLRQAVWNLCLNAVQAMPEGGELRVGGRRPTDDGRARLVLWVADTGPGIDANDLPHIFEPFYTTKADGTGLGLAVVYRIVQEHGGQVEARSVAGSGTTFTITLPGA